MALGGQIIVSTEQLRSQSNEVRTLLDTMKGQFESLKNNINGTSGYWIGDAGDAHRKQYMSCISTIEEMFARYMEHVVDLEKMAGVFEMSESAAMQISDSLPMSTLD